MRKERICEQSSSGNTEPEAPLVLSVLALAASHHPVVNSLTLLPFALRHDDQWPCDELFIFLFKIFLFIHRARPSFLSSGSEHETSRRRQGGGYYKRRYQRGIVSNIIAYAREKVQYPRLI